MKPSEKKELEWAKKTAWSPLLTLSASMLLISATLNTIGFSRVVDAYADSLVLKLKQQDLCTTDDWKDSITLEVKELRKLAHPSTTRNKK